MRRFNKKIKLWFQTFLGIKVEKDLQRKQHDRKERREQFGGIKMKKTQQYGKLCSPFQALSVPVIFYCYLLTDSHIYNKSAADAFEYICEKYGKSL